MATGDQLSWTASDPSVMPALLEGFRKNTSLHKADIQGCENGKWSQELSFLLYRNEFSRLLQDSDTDDRESLGLWSRALASVATRSDVLFHLLTSKAGLTRTTPGDDSNKRKRDDNDKVATYYQIIRVDDHTSGSSSQLTAHNSQFSSDTFPPMVKLTDTIHNYIYKTCSLLYPSSIRMDLVYSSFKTANVVLLHRMDRGSSSVPSTRVHVASPSGLAASITRMMPRITDNAPYRWGAL
jgi:hypothetical protein